MTPDGLPTVEEGSGRREERFEGEREPVRGGLSGRSSKKGGEDNGRP
jgi:hypothetical protein